MGLSSEKNYALVAESPALLQAAPELPYRPPAPKHYQPRIGVIGCGGISGNHLAAYRDAGWDVAALCDVIREQAEKRREEFFPAAVVYTQAADVLSRHDIDVVDLILHPDHRIPLIQASLEAGKHVLSQKPFVQDLETGRRLIALAQQQNRRLAVNQNGRWAPYASYMRCAIDSGLIGQVQSVLMRLNWDHTWCLGTPFERIHHLMLFDFGIHWFDLCAQFFAGHRALAVAAAATHAPGQKMRPPMLAQAMVTYEQGLATLQFDGHSRFGPEEQLQVSGSDGLLRTTGPLLASSTVDLFTRTGLSQAQLEGKWFNDGFRGAMGELLCAIEEDREPQNSAASTLASLELCFAAIHAADTGTIQNPGADRCALLLD
jgi:predicted dehydrogenase